MARFCTPVKVKSEDMEIRKSAKGWQVSTEEKRTHASTGTH